MSPERPRWFRRKLVVGVAVAVLALVAAAAVLALTRTPGDVSNPDVEFRAEPTATEVPQAPAKQGPKGDPLARFVWPDFGYSKDRRRYLPASFKVGPPFRKKWTRVAPVLLEFPPILVGRRLFNLDNDARAGAYVKQTGRTLWHRRLGGLAASSPAYGDGRLYFTVLQRTKSLRAGRVAALDPRNGKVVWQRDLPSRTESSPVYDRGRIYFGAEDGTVYALSARSGAIQWTFRASGAVKAALALSGGRLYFGAYGGRAYCIRASDGRQVWSTGTNGRTFGLAGGNFYSTPAVAFGRVYVGNTDGRMYSFSAATGRLAWARATGAYVYGSPAVAQVPGGQPTVWFGSYNGTFYAVAAKDGATRWTFTSGGRILGAPTVVGKYVYFSDYGKRTTYALNATTGNRAWTYPRGAFNPVVSDGRSIFLTGHSAMYRLMPKALKAGDVPEPTTAAQVRRMRTAARARKAAQHRRFVRWATKQRADAHRRCAKARHPRRCMQRWAREHPRQAKASRPR